MEFVDEFLPAREKHRFTAAERHFQHPPFIGSAAEIHQRFIAPKAARFEVAIAKVTGEIASVGDSDQQGSRSKSCEAREAESLHIIILAAIFKTHLFIL